ncbi:MAG TPA: MOSC domain-containing protein [Phototrophicaceae bacterium]|nr:MOSC domain-containing protein [Phototrophicaceae bacterium]
MTQIASIVYKPEGVPEPGNAFLRVDLDEARLIEGYGIEGDVKGGHPDRNLNLMSYETLTNLRAQGFYTEPGQMGEQIVIHQLDVDHLPPGTRLQLGESVIEVVKARNGCETFSRYQGKSLDLVKEQMGVMARVLTGGLIRVGDPVKVLKSENV